MRNMAYFKNANSNLKDKKKKLCQPSINHINVNLQGINDLIEIKKKKEKNKQKPLKTVNRLKIYLDNQNAALLNLSKSYISNNKHQNKTKRAISENDKYCKKSNSNKNKNKLQQPSFKGTNKQDSIYTELLQNRFTKKIKNFYTQKSQHQSHQDKFKTNYRYKKHLQRDLQSKKNNSNQKKKPKHIRSKDQYVNSKLYKSMEMKYQQEKRPIKFSFRTKGGKLESNPQKCNQDSYFIATDIGKHDQHLFGIADGHGSNGHYISNIIKKQMPKALQTDRWLNVSPKKAIHKFLYTLQQYLQIAEQPCADLSGSTLSSLLMTQNKLITGNVGDSRIILGRKLSEQKWQILQLTRDHKPSLKQQKFRIKKNGGRVQPFKDQEGNYIGPSRVWMKKKNMPGLAMSRSIGDNVAKKLGVTWQPQFFTFTRTKQDKFIVLASDGVWQFLSNEEVGKIIIPYYEQKNLQLACNMLMKQAYASWTVVLFHNQQDESVIDDITFIIIFL